jgi:ferric-dicitrate binding protein FerR (iron transport regulator)
MLQQFNETLFRWRTSVFRSALAALLCLLMAGLPVWAEPAGDQTAGTVKAMIPDATRNTQPLAVNATLQWNDLLQTNAKGRVRAVLTDGSILSLGSNGQLRVVQHDAATQQTAIDLNYGKLRNQVVKITQPGGKYEVKTPNAVIGVIGTDFYVAFKDGRTTVICYEGTLAVTPGAGAKVVDSNNSSTGSEQPIQVLPGQVVVIGAKPVGSALQQYSALKTASIKDTDVGEARRPHTGRTITLVALGVVAGLTIGLTQINSSPKPCGCK